MGDRVCLRKIRLIEQISSLCYDDEDAVVDAKLLRAYGIWEDRLFVLGFSSKRSVTPARK